MQHCTLKLTLRETNTPRSLNKCSAWLQFNLIQYNYCFCSIYVSQSAQVAIIKIPQTGWLKHQYIFVTVLVRGSLSPRCQQVHCLVRTHFLARADLLLSLFSGGRAGVRELSGVSFIREPISLMRALPLRLNLSPNSPPSKCHHIGD